MVSVTAIAGVLGALGGALVTGLLGIYRQSMREQQQNQRKRAEPFVEKEVQNLVDLNKSLSESFSEAVPIMNTPDEYIEGEVSPPDKAILDDIKLTVDELNSAVSTCTVFLSPDDIETIQEYVLDLSLMYAWAEFEYHWESENSSLDFIEELKYEINYEELSDSEKYDYKTSARKVLIKEYKEGDKLYYSDISSSYAKSKNIVEDRIKSPIDNLESE